MGIADLILAAAGKPVRGAGFTPDSDKLQPSEVPALELPPAWALGDEIERNYEDAINIADATLEYAQRFNSAAYSRAAWLEAAITIYGAARQFTVRLEEIAEALDYRSFSDQPTLNDRAQRGLDAAAASMGRAVQIADALYQGAQDLANEKIEAAREKASRAEWPNILTRIAELGRDAAVAAAESVGEAARKGFEATVPWGPIALAALLVTGGVVAAVVLSK